MKKLTILFILVSLLQLSQIANAQSNNYWESPIYKLIAKALDADINEKNSAKAAQYLEEAIQLMGNKFSSDLTKEHDELVFNSLYDLYKWLSELYIKQGRYEDSLQILKYKITNKVSLVELLIEIGGRLKTYKKDQGAILYLEEALTLAKEVFESDLIKVNSYSLYNWAAKLSDIYIRQGRYEDSVQTLKRHIRNEELLIKKLYHQRFVVGFPKKDKEAALYLEAALTVAEEIVGSDPTKYRDELLRDSLYPMAEFLSNIYLKQGRYEDSVQLLKHHKAIRQLVDKASFFYSLDKNPAQAIPYMEAALMLAEKKFRSQPKTPQTELSQSSWHSLSYKLSEMYIEVGRYQDAIQNLKDHIDDKELLIDKLLLISHWKLELKKKHELYTLFLEEIAKIAEKEFSADPTKQKKLADIIKRLADHYNSRYWYEEALQAFHRYLAIMEKIDEPEKDSGKKLYNTNMAIANIYLGQGRYSEALPIYQRSMSIAKETWGEGFYWIFSQGAVGGCYRELGRLEEAEQIFEKCIQWIKKKYGTDIGYLEGDILSSAEDLLAQIYIAQGRYREAKTLLTHAFEHAKDDGKEWLGTATIDVTFAQLYNAQGRYHDALSLLKRAIPVLEEYYGDSELTYVFKIQSIAYQGLNQHQKAIESIRRAANPYRQRLEHAAGNRSSISLSELQQARDIYVNYVDAFINFIKLQERQKNNIANEAFEAGQLARATSTSVALAGMGARFAAGDNQLANIVRKHQDLSKRWRRLNNKLGDAVSRSPHDQEKENIPAIREALSDIDFQMQELDKKIAEEFPAYNQLIGSFAISLKEVQKLLAPDEALITYLLADKHSYLWVVRSTFTEVYILECSAEKIETMIKQLRQGLDPTGVSQLADIRPFGIEVAYRLYQNILAPAESALTGVNNIMIVPDKALQSIPFGVLVTQKLQLPITDFASYRGVAWLGQKYALTTLPSVASLKALRVFAKQSKAKEPFAGFGDPLLAGDPGSGRGITLVMLFSQGNVADREIIKSLPRLPETADELKAIARALNTDIKNVYLKGQATETRVKTMDLFSKQVIAFATHGLVAGEIAGLAEPALVLTPQEQSTEKDDGLLTASEVAQLKLNADLVLLSACNTAAGDGTPRAEGLSGLAKAFFYAGSRSLIVSHWGVSSDAAVELTTGMFDESAKHPEIGKSEALRRSMRALMNNNKKTYFAHPMFWAPFVVVGEGSAVR